MRRAPGEECPCFWNTTDKSLALNTTTFVNKNTLKYFRNDDFLFYFEWMIIIKLNYAQYFAIYIYIYKYKKVLFYQEGSYKMQVIVYLVLTWLRYFT